MPKVSVVIPVYNGERYLAETVESVFAQTFSDWELIIVDDGSRDATAEIAQAYGTRDVRVRVVRQHNSSPAGARNGGLREVDPSCEYVIFLDYDDLWEPDTLSSLVNALNENPQSIGAYAVYRYIDADGQSYDPGTGEAYCRDRHAIEGGHVVEWPPHRPATFAVLVCRNVIQPSVALIRRNTLEEVGPFDPDPKYWGCEDWEMWLRLSQRGSFAFVDKVLLGYRRHPSNISRNRRKMYQNEMHVYRAYVQSAALTKEQRQLVRLGYRWRHQTGQRYWWARTRESIASRKVLSAANQLRHTLMDVGRYYKGWVSLEISSAMPKSPRRLPSLSLGTNLGGDQSLDIGSIVAGPDSTKSPPFHDEGQQPLSLAQGKHAQSKL